MEGSGQFHAPAPLALQRVVGTHWRGGYVGPRAGLDAVTKRKKITAPAGYRTQSKMQ